MQIYHELGPAVMWFFRSTMKRTVFQSQRCQSNLFFSKEVACTSRPLCISTFKFVHNSWEIWKDSITDLILTVNLIILSGMETPFSRDFTMFQSVAVWIMIPTSYIPILVSSIQTTINYFWPSLTSHRIKNGLECGILVKF